MMYNTAVTVLSIYIRPRELFEISGSSRATTEYGGLYRVRFFHRLWARQRSLSSSAGVMSLFPPSLPFCLPSPDIYFHAFQFHILWRKCVGKSVVCFTRVRKSSNGNFFSPKRGAGPRVRGGQGVVRRVWPQIFQTRTSDCCEEECFCYYLDFCAF